MPTCFDARCPDPATVKVTARKPGGRVEVRWFCAGHFAEAVEFTARRVRTKGEVCLAIEADD